MSLRPLCLSIATLLMLSACQSVPDNANTVHQVTAKNAADAAPAAAEVAVAQHEASNAARQRQIHPLSPPSPPAVHSAQQSKHVATTMAAPTTLDSVQILGGSAGTTVTTEHYAHRDDNPVKLTREQPVSTFSIDVDTGSYTNVRRMLRDGIRPPADAVRAEEFLNYFDYAHPARHSLATPFRVTTELAPAPWNSARQLLMIGIKGYDVPQSTLPPANLVFLIDTSGSMADDDKLPLLKRSFALLTRQLRPQDTVSIVVYAGSAGLVLPPTSGRRRDDILGALERLDAGGSTNGGEGIALAYATARQGFVKGGINRVILATDGDFNVGTVDINALKTLVGDQRKSGIALSTLGFGAGNYNDEVAEQLADIGDVKHAYIDSLQEANKVLVQQMGATLMTIASDVKIQLEFNPAVVAEYRLIGYENRVLNREDFANDRVDAGDMGAGHQVTALYEITPVVSTARRLPALRYAAASAAQTDSSEVAHLRLRYKANGEHNSRLIEAPVMRSALQSTPGESMRFASAVAGFADALRGGSRMDGWSWKAIADTARGSLGHDKNGERAELIRLVEQARALIETDAEASANITRR